MKVFTWECCSNCHSVVSKSTNRGAGFKIWTKRENWWNGPVWHAEQRQDGCVSEKCPVCSNAAHLQHTRPNLQHTIKNLYLYLEWDEFWLQATNSLYLRNGKRKFLKKCNYAAFAAHLQHFSANCSIQANFEMSNEGENSALLSLF